MAITYGAILALSNKLTSLLNSVRRITHCERDRKLDFGGILMLPLSCRVSEKNKYNAATARAGAGAG